MIKTGPAISHVHGLVKGMPLNHKKVAYQNNGIYTVQVKTPSPN
jgi:hypothetical protein